MNDNPTSVGQNTRVVIAAIGFRLFKERRVSKNTAGAIKFAEAGILLVDKTRKKGDEKVAPVGTEGKRFASYITLDRIASGAQLRAVKVYYKVCVCVCVCVCVSLNFVRLSNGKRRRRKNDANQNANGRRWVNYTGRRFKRKPPSSKKAIFAEICAFRKSRREQY